MTVLMMTPTLQRELSVAHLRLKSTFDKTQVDAVPGCSLCYTFAARHVRVACVRKQRVGQCSCNVWRPLLNKDDLTCWAARLLA